jgi:hypothetical protein
MMSVLCRGRFKTCPYKGQTSWFTGNCRGLKTFSSKQINEIRKSSGGHVWQRNYYEHVIRDETELDRVRRYIVENPIKWALDRENPAGKTKETEAPGGHRHNAIISRSA